MYRILPYTYAQAKKLNVKVMPSKTSNKKIDVYTKDNEYITSVGAKGYLDFPTYKYYYGSEIANKRRKLYKLRHSKDRKIKYSNGWYADKLLW